MTAEPKKQDAKDDSADRSRNLGKWIGIGAAGIGSAAVAAAVLYASRSKPKSATQPELSARADDAVD
jgi:hypothetical protein